MADNNALGDMLDNLVQNKPEEAQVNFHDYLQARVQEILGKDAEVESNTVSDKE
jgi:hypothetical protein